MTRPLARLLLTGTLLAPLALAACNGSGTPTPQEANLTDTARTPVALNGADASGDRTDSLKYQENATAAGDVRVDTMGLGAGSQSDAGSVEGGQQNPDAAAPAKK